MRVSVPGQLLALAALATPGAATAQSSLPATVGAESRAADTVRVGCSGGITGDGSGNVATGVGDLASYSQPLQGTPTYTLPRRDSAAAAAVFAELDRLRFDTLRYDEHGVRTCVLELRSGAVRHSVTWPAGQPPAALRSVLAALSRAFADDRRGW